MDDFETPVVFDYLDYRKFLREFADYKSKYSASFSFRNFSQKAGISSPNYYQNVVQGKRNLGNKMLERFVRGLNFQDKEARYFRALVNYNQSRTSEFKTACLRDLLEMQRMRKAAPTWVVDNHVRQDWYTLVIWELITCKDFEATPANIVRALNNEITPREAETSLRILIRAGYIKKDGKHRYAQGPVLIGSNDELADSVLQRNHQVFIEKSIKHLNDPVKDREFQGLTIAMSPIAVKTLKSRLKDLIKEFAMDFAHDAEATRVYRINLQAFPLTEDLTEEEKTNA